MPTHVPMLREQRDLLDIPRGPGRFRAYLDVMIGGTDDLVLPLQAFNPMSKGHVTDLLDGLLGLDAEGIAAVAVAEAGRRLEADEVDLRVGLVVADDVAGGWTDRALTEANGLRAVPRAMLSRGWLVVTHWASDPACPHQVREEVLAEIYRQLWLSRRGAPSTLRGMMELGGRALAFAGASTPALDPEDLAYTRAVVGPYLDSDDFPTAFACLFGDAESRRVGYRPLGLSPRAGLALALAEARTGPTSHSPTPKAASPAPHTRPSSSA